MRIVHISASDIQGGAARAAYRLAQGLRQLGHESSMLVKQKNSSEPWVRQWEPPGTAAARRLEEQAAWIETFCVYGHRTSISNSHFSVPIPAYDVSTHEEIQRADVVNLHWVAGLLSPESIARLARPGKPIVWTLHDQRPFTGGCHYSAGCRHYEVDCAKCPQLDRDDHGLTAAVLCDASGQSHSVSRLICPSRWLAQCAGRSSVFRQTRISVIPNGLDTSVFTPGRAEARQRLQWDPDAIYLLSGADVLGEARKGFDLLCSAARHCLTDLAFQKAVLEKKINFVFYGNGAAPPLLDFPAQWLGRFENDAALAQLYAASDAFILPSREDNFPNMILESMCCGAPVIGFGIGGLPDAIIPGENGLLALPENPLSLAEAIKSFVSDAELRRKLAENCARHIPAQYNLSAQAGQYLGLYQEEISRSAAAPQSETVLPLTPAPLMGSAFAGIFRPLLHNARVEARARGGVPALLLQPAISQPKLVEPALPIAVLIPSRNCASLMSDHLQSLQQWIDLAEEIVVVDSNSTDGTVELLRAGLKHPRIKFLTHPPGLYQSWNFGIQNVTAKYVYVATVGDPIMRHGIQHLYDVAEEFLSDVVISKPAFISATGQPLPEDRWPIDVILDSLHIDRPQLLSTAEQFMFAATNPWGAILGSSASNLYLTSCLKARPFPTEFGTAGDAGWGIQNIFEISIAITPERFSSFRQHEKAYLPSEYHVESLLLKLSQLVESVVDREKETNPRVPPILKDVRWFELVEALRENQILQAQLERYREGIIPWFLNPWAWKARRDRNAVRKILSDIQAHNLRLKTGSQLAA